MGWASMYHVKKKLLFMFIILACHFNKHTYLLIYIQLSTHAGEEAIKYQIKQLCNGNT